jgi:hypothetical protein
MSAIEHIPMEVLLEYAADADEYSGEPFRAEEEE